MNPFEAVSKNDLRNKVRGSYVAVPLRTEGRKTEHTESWVACRFLAALAQADLLRFPLNVEPGDRPDLVLTMPSGRIGIEIVEAVPENEARVAAYSEDKGIEGLRYVPRYRAGEPLLPEREIKRLAKNETQQIGHMGNVIERDWVEAMLHFVNKKANKFLKEGFKKYQENWLIIYDNWSLRPHEVDATKMLDRHFQHHHIQHHRTVNPFGKIFVQMSRNIWEYRTGASVLRHPIPTDWF